MSEKIKKAIEEKIVEPSLQKIKKEVNGEVLKVFDQNTFNDNLNLANVKIIDSETGDERILTEVPIIHGAFVGNIDGRHIQKGDHVVVNFVNGNPTLPQIVGRSYPSPERRKEETKTEKGMCIPDANGYFG